MVVTILQPCLADALCEKPRGLLCDTKFASHLRAGDAFAGAGEHVACQKPLQKRQAAFGQNGARANAEMLPTVLAAVGHRLVIFDLNHVG